jgi:hypothetical protein
MRKIAIENPDEAYTEDNAGLMAASSSDTFAIEHEAATFDEYTQKVVILFNHFDQFAIFFLVGRCLNNIKGYET